VKPTEDYVRNKIRTSTPKNRGVESRAYAWGHRLIKKAAKKLAKELDSMPDEYVRLALIRLGEQLNATKKMWDVNEKKLIDIPDEKIRQDAALAILAYKWGKPVERSISATAKFEDLAELQERLSQSPTFKQISSQKTVLGKEITPALQDPQGPDHSGRGNGPAL
jgi:hypothetical protein